VTESPYTFCNILTLVAVGGVEALSKKIVRINGENREEEVVCFAVNW
jgi:hypothetical protein